MKLVSTFTALAAGVLWATAGFAAQQPPAGAPAGTTGLCKDGTYYSGATKRGACRGHKGVKEWYGATGAAAAPAAPPAASGAAAAPSTPAAAPSVRSRPAAAGGGAGQVWVNHKSKVYHCQGDRWYGKTKDGEYMTEADAAAKGYRPDHGKPCK